MQGDHETLANTVFEDDDDSATAAALLHYALASQFVACPYLPDRVWEVATGSGIGQRMSGEVSDFYFFQRFERSFPLAPQRQAEFNIKVWLRFRNDIFTIVGSGGAPWQEFVSAIQTHCRKDYEVKLESASTLEATMLDVTLWKQRCSAAGFTLAWRPHIKSTEQTIYLDEHSFHSPEVLRSWPLAEAHRLRKRSSSKAIFEESRRQFLDKLRGLQFSASTLDLVSRIQFRRQGFVQHQARAPAPRKSFWWIMHFHPVLHSARLGAKAQGILYRWFPVVEPFLGNICIRVSWSNGCPHFSDKLVCQGIHDWLEHEGR